MFSTTFLHFHSLLGITGSVRRIDDEEVGLKEKPDDTRYTGSVSKLNIMDWIPNFMPSWGTADSGGGGGEGQVCRSLMGPGR